MFTVDKKNFRTYPGSNYADRSSDMQSIIEQFSSTIRTASESEQPLQIQGGGSKAFYGNPPPCQTRKLAIGTFHGIVDYEPTELVMTARAGTSLAEIESILHQNGQMLAFEPPYFSDLATLGGCIATGLSGPRRATAGAARDFVLGVRILDGAGRDLHFGGKVMKNVAGYDVSRLMAGSMGTLGVLLEISLKVLPLPASERTLRLEMDPMRAIEAMNRWAGKPLPISATCHVDGQLFIRLSGADSAIRAAHTQIGGEQLHDDVQGKHFWQSIREQTHHFFKPATPLWRLSIKSTTPPLDLPGKQLIEWNGALRWLTGDTNRAVETYRRAASNAGGHATLFRSQSQLTPAFQPLPPALSHIHQRLKQQFDPAGILNPGRLYPEF